jgi:hypothetical protein
MPFGFVFRIFAMALLTAIVACGPAAGDDARISVAINCR